MRSPGPFVPVVLLCLTVLTGTAPVAGAAESDERDAFIRGYAAAILDRELKVDVEAIVVNNGAITVTAEGLDGSERQKVIDAISSIDGVISVNVAAEHSDATPVMQDAAPRENAPRPGLGGEPSLLSTRRVFDPLLADPRWPHMSTSAQQYNNHDLGKSIGAVSYGGRLPLVRRRTDRGDDWEIGLQGAVFAAFDLASDSGNLLNADYTVGVTWAGRRENTSVMARFFHQSSHIGDEFLLENPEFRRDNYSWEAVDIIVSQDLCGRTVRLYGGGRGLIDVDPGYLKHWSVQYGAEWRSSHTYVNELLRPVAAVDMQHDQQNDWEADVSVRAGVQVELPDMANHILQVLIEYYNGHSPHGQFFADRVDFVGIGAHFYY